MVQMQSVGSGLDRTGSDTRATYTRTRARRAAEESLTLNNAEARENFDHLTSRRQHPVRLVDPEWNDRVGVLLTAKALVGVNRIEDFG
jgi:hypothetical protein